MRCEGWTRHGGAFTLGRPEWRQCENEGTVMLTASNKGEEPTTEPMCQGCWQKCIDADDITVIEAKPIEAG